MPAWRERGLEPVGWFHNPNIQPVAELERRLESMRRYSRTIGLELVVEERPQRAAAWGAWLDSLGQASPDERCAACLRLRLDAAAEAASELGFTRFSTSLSVSPYQRHDLIQSAGETAAAQHGVDFAYLDLGGLFRASYAESRRLGLYRQSVLRLRRRQVGDVARAGGAASDAGGERMTGAAIDLAGLDYELPEELIAQRPIEPRDAARLLVVERSTGRLDDRDFGDLPELLRRGDLLVRNDTRVFPARAYFRRATGGRIEVLFLRPEKGPAGEWASEVGERSPDAPAGELWEALLRGRPRAGEELAGEAAAADWRLVCERALGDGRWSVRSTAERPVLEQLERFGHTPVPPYIHEPVADPERYQTVYARRTGSAAAPTAGLHFTPAVDRSLGARGVEVATVTLHVGLGTFKPLIETRLDENRLHSETYEVEAATWARVLAARAQGRRVVAVGTTTVRVARTPGAVSRPSAAGRDRPLHQARLRAQGGRRGADQLPPAAHEPARPRHGLRRCRRDARRLRARRRGALPVLQFRRRDADPVRRR